MATAIQRISDPFLDEISRSSFDWRELFSLRVYLYIYINKSVPLFPRTPPIALPLSTLVSNHSFS
jgi:hypothetical protein